MSKKSPLNESALKTSFSEIGHSLVRELAMAAKKVSIYGLGHPLALRSLEKPFLTLNSAFRFKRWINFNLQDDQLYVLNVRLKESTFVDDLTRFMQVKDVYSLLFERRITMTEFGNFIGELVKRVHKGNLDNLLVDYVRSKKIESIEVNSDLSFDIFEKYPKYRGSISGDYSVKRIATDQLGTDVEFLLTLIQTDQEALDEHRIDFDFAVVEYLLPEAIASLSATELCTMLTATGRDAATADKGSPERIELQKRFDALTRLVDHHPERARIAEETENQFGSDQDLRSVAGTLASPVAAIRMESSARIDEVTAVALEESSGDDEFGEFADAFKQLLMTGQRSKADTVTHRLMNLLDEGEANQRQRGLEMLLAALGQLSLPMDNAVLSGIIDRVGARLSTGGESFEYSEFIWQLFHKAVMTSWFDPLVQLTSRMAQRRTNDKGVIIYDSAMLRKVFDSISQPGMINRLVDEMMRNDPETNVQVRQILINIGTESVALALSHIISHPIRRIRQMSLKILAELGASSVKVFSEILMDDAMFERDEDRHELPDAKWYVVRNSVFVLGLLRDEECIVPLRFRVSDRDVRVRREIISALEKIGGDEASDLLLALADDPVREIQERAVMTLGLIGTSDMVPLIVDIAQRNPSLAVRIVAALAKLGGEEARSFLMKLLEDSDEFAQLTSERVSKDNLRVATVRALGAIGDDTSIESVREFKATLSASHRLFKNSPLNKTISEVLQGK